ncbi:hypothetical protein LWI29_010082 [Acer saccharum]|uniref:FAR1 domain-containing protein n=1 Tax=Acer saccharum TaxID=4024 RepID=A0AA39SA87_ACESA|nr:hypothetical protein LWI29_010082 [Acer saccharum]
MEDDEAFGWKQYKIGRCVEMDDSDKVMVINEERLRVDTGKPKSDWKMNINSNIGSTSKSNYDLKTTSSSQWEYTNTTHRGHLYNTVDEEAAVDPSFQTDHTPSTQHLCTPNNTTSLEVEPTLSELDDPAKFTSLQPSDVIGKEFASVQKAEAFYKNYSLFVGFSIRKDEMRRDRYVESAERLRSSRCGARLGRVQGGGWQRSIYVSSSSGGEGDQILLEWGERPKASFCWSGGERDQMTLVLRVVERETRFCWSGERDQKHRFVGVVERETR